ncbi:MAG TPA: type II toxin-antitoxin system prevent-host-death family antitoxin [Myxococcota bacterium]|nr:type II toxin-antitoxin system prevent-host-death family antitoxin [Myxococcota bacterium]
MTATLTAMDLRHKLGEVLSKVEYVHNCFIIERKGKPAAAIVPLSVLEYYRRNAAKRIDNFIDTSKSKLSDEEAMQIANEEIKSYRAEKRKKK